MHAASIAALEQFPWHLPDCLTAIEPSLAIHASPPHGQGSFMQEISFKQTIIRMPSVNVDQHFIGQFIALYWPNSHGRTKFKSSG